MEEKGVGSQLLSTYTLRARYPITKSDQWSNEEQTSPAYLGSCGGGNRADSYSKVHILGIKLGNLLSLPLGNMHGNMVGNMHVNILGKMLGNIMFSILGNKLGNMLGNKLGNMLGNMLVDFLKDLLSCLAATNNKLWSDQTNESSFGLLWHGARIGSVQCGDFELKIITT